MMKNRKSKIENRRIWPAALLLVFILQPLAFRLLLADPPATTQSPYNGAGSTALASGSTVTLARGGNLTTFAITLASGTAPYTSTVILSDTGANRGDKIDLAVTYPASTNPTLQVFDTGTSGTLLHSSTGAAVAGNAVISFVNLTGTAWTSTPKGDLSLRYLSTTTVGASITSSTAASLTGTINGATQVSGAVPSATNAGWGGYLFDPNGNYLTDGPTDPVSFYWPGGGGRALLSAGAIYSVTGTEVINQSGQWTGAKIGLSSTANVLASASGSSGVTIPSATETSGSFVLLLSNTAGTVEVPITVSGTSPNTVYFPGNIICQNNGWVETPGGCLFGGPNYIAQQAAGLNYLYSINIAGQGPGAPLFMDTYAYLYNGQPVVTSTNGNIVFNNLGHWEAQVNTYSGTLATGTIALSSTTTQGEELRFLTAGPITSITVTGSQAIGVPVTSASANQSFIWIATGTNGVFDRY